MTAYVYNPQDTIAAISTALGPGGIGIVRMSGPKAIALVDKIFMAKNKKPCADAASHTLHYGWIVQGKQKDIVDEVLVSLMRAPTSYTTEDVIEISCHGGMMVLREILDVCLNAGARLADPGEFTKRAFLNGRIDLTQAEAVLDIISAKTAASLRISTHQLKGDLLTKLEAIRQDLMQAYTALEAYLNFSEEELSVEQMDDVGTMLTNASEEMDFLLKNSAHGRLLREGVRIVICGKSNVGKSSLLNVLLQEPRAIVSNIPGTTRDTVEESAQLYGIPLQLVDTAGLLKPRDDIEEEAIRRSHLQIQGADLVLFVSDASQPLGEEDYDLLAQTQGQNAMVVVNKSDLVDQAAITKRLLEFHGPTALAVSALKGTGIKALREAIVDRLWHSDHVDTQGILLNNVRHVASLKKAQQNVCDALDLLRQKISFDVISESVKSSIYCLDRVTGREVDQDLIEQIFSQFCIGK